MDTHARQRGFTILEIMVSLALGLIVMYAALQIFQSNKQTYRTGEALARIQENGRFAMQIITQDLRMAGHLGCGSRRSRLADPIIFAFANNIPSPDDFDFNPAQAVLAFNDTTDWGGPDMPTDAAGNVLTLCDAAADGAICQVSDAIRLVRGSEVVALTTADQADAGAELPLVDQYIADGDTLRDDFTSIDPEADGSVDDDLFVVTDCLRADLFRVGAVGTDGLTPADDLSQAYAASSLVMPLVSATYFVATDGTDGVPSLYRLPICYPTDCTTVAAQEIAEGVEGMQLLLGLDTDEDSFTDTYVEPAAGVDWSQLASVRLSLLLKSDSDFVTDTPVPVTFTDGAGATITVNDGAGADRRLRMVFTSTVGLRNHVP